MSTFITAIKNLFSIIDDEKITILRYVYRIEYIEDGL
jgi:hypothetical protein